MSKKQSAEYIEAQLEFDPNEIGGTKLSEYEIRVYEGTPKNPKNVAMSVIISKKGTFNAVKKRKISKNDIQKH